jgi:hypothetical protein
MLVIDHVFCLCLQSHGFEHLVTFFNLKKLGLLVEQDTSKPKVTVPVKLRRSQFKQLASKLNLVSEFIYRKE